MSSLLPPRHTELGLRSQVAETLTWKMPVTKLGAQVIHAIGNTSDGSASARKPRLILVGESGDQLVHLADLRDIDGWETHLVGAFEEVLTFNTLLPTCVVSPWRLGGHMGGDLLKLLAAHQLPFSVIFVDSDLSTRDVVLAMTHGAHSVIDAPVDAADFRTIVGGAMKASASDMEAYRELSGLTQRIGLLTPAEKNVLDLIMEGLPNKTIANRLDIAMRTVEMRRQYIFRKVGCRSICELVQQVVRCRELADRLAERFRAASLTAAESSSNVGDERPLGREDAPTKKG